MTEKKKTPKNLLDDVFNMSIDLSRSHTPVLTTELERQQTPMPKPQTEFEEHFKIPNTITEGTTYDSNRPSKPIKRSKKK